MLYGLCFFSILGAVMFVAALILGSLSVSDSQKVLPFECGFEVTYLNRLPFSLQFFLIGIIFVIFDLEIVIILATVFDQSQLTLKQFLLIVSFFIFLVGSLLVEWKLNKLIWFK